MTLTKLRVTLDSDDEGAKSRASAAPLVVRISRGATVQQCLERICAAWELNATKCRLWDYYNLRRYNLLAKTDQRLSDAKIYAEQDVLLEVELSGGGWRHAEEATDSGAMDLFDGTGGSSSSTYNGGGSSTGGSIWGGARNGMREDTVVDGARPSTVGVVGLSNLGNTCFMNSMLQCLSNAAPLREYFVNGHFEPELNPDNPLGAEGLLAQAFAALLKLMWGNGASVVSPRNFKHILGRFAPQFAGYGQQDSQELCNYVLDKLHEDVNRVKKKPYIENYEAKEGEADADVAAEVRRRHRLRNDSRIADLFEGYFKSTVVCPHCKRVSVTFDPFMSVAVPLSVADARKLTVTLRTYDGTHRMVRVTVPLNGTVKQLLAATVEQHAASSEEGAAPLNVDSLVCVEVYNAKLQAIYTPSTKLDKLQNGDLIFVCETAPQQVTVVARAASEDAVPVVAASSVVVGATTPTVDATAVADDPQLLVVCVQRAPPSGYGVSNKFMGLPLTLTLPKSISGKDLTALITAKLQRYQKDENGPPPSETAAEATGGAGDAEGGPGAPSNAPSGGAILGSALHGGGSLDDDGICAPSAPAPSSAVRSVQWRLFHSTMAAGSFGYEALGQQVPYTDEPCEFAAPGRGGGSSYSPGSTYGSLGGGASTEAKLESRHIVLEWMAPAFSARGHYDRAKVEADEADKSGIGCGRTPAGERGPAAGSNGVELTACLELFSREETLDAENAWYCDRCKDFREATKKLQIWSLPSILVVHLKRFSAQGMWRRKNDQPVDFPFEIDLAPYCLECQQPNGNGNGNGHTAPVMYDLMSVSNHYGSTGGGHYTAFARHSDSGQWHKFDDSHTGAVEPKDVVTPAAYVLMYGRRGGSKPRASPEF